MVYITHKTPVVRSGDTLIGQIMGYMAEYVYWIQREADCAEIDAIVPEWFPICYVDDFIIAMMRNSYNKKYQSVYNQGADQGNKIQSNILGWVDQTKKDVTTQFNNLLTDAKNKLQSQINEINILTSKFKTQLADLETAKNRLVAEINDHLARINDLDKRVRDLEASTFKIPAIPYITRPR